MVPQTHNVQLELPSEPSASAAVRYTLDEMPMPGALVERARLLASELVTNSVRHVGAGPAAPISVTVDLDADRLRVTVDDVGNGDVRVRGLDDRRDGGGYGLFIVDAMADRWGTSPLLHGTRVWFELDVSPGRDR
jgi:anti-sigma regulatory factor (Ser/Thr protein kinase)